MIKKIITAKEAKKKSTIFGNIETQRREKEQKREVKKIIKNIRKKIDNAIFRGNFCAIYHHPSYITSTSHKEIEDVFTSLGYKIEIRQEFNWGNNDTRFIIRWGDEDD